jgi:hypothetical protein
MMGIMGRTRTATAAAVVMLALLLQLLAPLPVSRAQATPICTGAGVILLLAPDLPPPDGAPAPDHANGDHCLLCLLPRADALSAGGTLAPVRTALAEVVVLPTPRAPALPPPAFTPQTQRGPPIA